MFCLLASIKLLMFEIPVFVSMFMYIDFASAENSSAFSGMISHFKSRITSKEFLIKDFTSGRSSFMQKSSQLEKTEEKLLLLLMTGLSVMGVL